MTKIQDRRALALCLLARVLSGITAILRVIDDGDGRTATHCLYALFVCRRAGCHTQVHCSRYGSHYPNPKIQHSAPNHRRGARARDRQTRESANTKSTHYFISKLQSTLPQRKEYEQGITTMEEDEELMTIEISALLCSIISQGRELKTMRNIE